jgi:hypothetical protein
MIIWSLTNGVTSPGCHSGVPLVPMVLRALLMERCATPLAHLILHFASFGIDLFFVALSGFLHQQLGHLQDLFTLLGQVLTIMVEL